MTQLSVQLTQQIVNVLWLHFQNDLLNSAQCAFSSYHYHFC